MRTQDGDVDLDLVVSSATPAAEDVRVLTLRRRDGAALPAWSPGAHIDLLLPGEMVRQYSLCGDRDQQDAWTVAVLREDESRGGSAYLHDDVAVGSALPARGPRNHFPLEDAGAYVFVAGGVGVAPLLPMITEAERRGAAWRLVYGGRRRSAMAFADELVARHGDRVTIVAEDDQGQLDVRRIMAGADGADVYCCGPEGLITAVEAAHASDHRGNLHVERFSPRTQSSPPTSNSFEVEAARSRTVVQVAPGTSILEALESAGLRMLSSCREGICGTCELAVLSGVPEHRDSILTEDERTAGETMFVCVSRSLSPRLVLDL